jgi:hypothetical protein
LELIEGGGMMKPQALYVLIPAEFEVFV